MRFEEVLPALRAGKKAKRPDWDYFHSIKSAFSCVNEKDILAEDWEIEPEPKLKRFAYIHTLTGTVILILSDRADELKDAPDYERCPWLDEP